MTSYTININLSKLLRYYNHFDSTLNIEKILIENYSYYVDNEHNFIVDVSNIVLNKKFKTDNVTYDIKKIDIFYKVTAFIKYCMTINHFISKEILKNLDRLDFNNIYFNRIVDDNLTVEFKIT